MIKSYHIAVSVPIYLEVFGLNIAEALAMGKPVLATRCGGAEMQIEDGVNGWLVEPNNIKALTQKMQEISDSFMGYNIHYSVDRVIPIDLHVKNLYHIYEKGS